MSPLRVALCNEVLREMDFAAQCAYAAALGYDGLEVAPFTLGPAPHDLPAAERARLRRAAADAGIAITGLHWLLLAPPGLSITSPDPAVRRQTVEVMRALVDLCADLGGTVMVHGSPGQRAVAPDDDPAAARARARDCLAAAAERAEAARIVYCLEPLSRSATRLVNTVEEAAALVREIGRPSLRTMVDTSAAAASEGEPVGAVLDRWLPTGLVAHVQVNDPNRRGPGQGRERFAPVVAALHRHGYAGVVAVEPFEYQPDGRGAAARAIGYLRGLDEALAWSER